MVIDAHCHLGDELIYNEEILNKIKNCSELLACVCLGGDEKSSALSVKIANENEKVFACVGFHPEYLDHWQGQKSFNEIKALLKNEKVVAVGEVGLDYHYTKENIELQKQVLKMQIDLAYENKLPICVHCRDAVEDMYEILCEYKHKLKYGIVLHCYSEGPLWVERFKELGVYFSFAGNFTFKNYNSEVAKLIPLDKIMIETDSPYLTPVPKRGQINDPTNVSLVAKKLAEVLEMDYDEVCKITTENAKRFYNLPL